MSVLPSPNVSAEMCGPGTTATEVRMRQEIENVKVRAALNQINNTVSPPFIADAGGSAVGAAIAHGLPYQPSMVWTKERNSRLSLSITVCENGYVVSGADPSAQYVCKDMDDIKDRVGALLAAHQMDMQK